MALRRHARGRGLRPELVLCSSARRTIETWELVAPGVGPGTPVAVEDRLYAAGAGQLLARLRDLDDRLTSVLVIAHNPGLEDLAHELVGGGDPAARARMARKYPTGALATLSFRTPWPDLGSGSADLVEFVVPKDLPPDDPA